MFGAHRHSEISGLQTDKSADGFLRPVGKAIFILYLEELYLKGEAFYKQFKKYCKAEKNMI